jgi:hypothetical protein
MKFLYEFPSSNTAEVEGEDEGEEGEGSMD